jgi:hypothetical protein
MPSTVNDVKIPRHIPQHVRGGPMVRILLSPADSQSLALASGSRQALWLTRDPVLEPPEKGAGNGPGRSAARGTTDAFRGVLDRQERGELSQGEAAEMLGVSERTFRRWRDRLRDEGPEGLRDRRIGRPSSRRAAAEGILRMLGGCMRNAIAASR